MKPDHNRVLYALTIGGSSTLLFLVQPMLAKAILPRFGGTAAVWVTCMLFYQVVLLAGYLYAYWSTRYLGPRTRAAVHGLLLAVSLAALPLRVGMADATSGPSPTWSILRLLAVSVGLPYFLLSTTSPLLQAWYAERGARFPYRLFAVSNAASLVALFGYPLAIEPLLPLEQQMRWWSIAYLCVAALLLAVMALGRGKAVERAAEFQGPQHRPLLWIALAACASALWLAVANHLSQEVAAIPFLWVLPLGVYLLSFILCFEGGGWYRPLWFRWLLPAAWIAAGWRIAMQGSAGGLEWEIPIFAVVLLICCVFCHGELADSKPDPRDGLAYFYLMVALGGALGAVFVGLVAPHIFSAYLELPIGIVGCAFLAFFLLFGMPPRRLLRLALFSLAAFVISLRYRPGDAVDAERNFYGALQVRDIGSGADRARALYNGRTLHGIEFLAPERRNEATAFYGLESGVGRVLGAPAPAGRRIGVIGLGAGTLAAYGRRGDVLRFYEINPAVIDIAQHEFAFLSGSPARTDVVAGDGRLELEKEPAGAFDVIVLDAFSDDSIPVHLLTREAFEIYFRHLREGGTLAVHITNRYLDLDPVLTGVAQAMGKHVVLIHNQPDAAREVAAADWAVMSAGSLDELSRYAHPPSGRPVRLWTDDFSNLWSVLR